MAVDDIVIVEYNPEWPRLFEEEKARIQSALGDIVVEIAHFGSTSIPGIAAKPTIDIQVAVQKLPLTDERVAALGNIGFEFRRYNEPWWAFLRKGIPRTHHLHLFDYNVDEARENWNRTMLFRDYLGVHPDDARVYEELKRDLAVERVPDSCTRSTAPASLFQE